MEWCDRDAAAMGLSAIYLCILRSACARAEPVVSACVLEKSLEIYSKNPGRLITAADAIYVLAEERCVKRWGSMGMYNVMIWKLG